MATKKKMTKKATTSKESTVAIPVRRLMERVATEFKHELVDTKIPAFKSIGADKDLVAHYFLHRELYADLLGANIALLDRVLRSSLATIIAKDLMATLENPDRTFPGLWDEFHVKSLAMTMVNVATIADDESGATFLSVRRHPNGMPTKEEATQYQPASWMPYAGYTPDNLYRFLLVAHNTTISTIISEIEAAVPAATFSASGEPATIRYGRQFGELMHEALQDKAEAGMTIEEEADQFIKLTEKPLITYMTAIMSESGFNLDAIGDMLANSRAAATYTTKNKGGKQASTFIHPWTKITYTLFSTERQTAISSAMASVELSPADICTAAKVLDRKSTVKDEETGEEKEVAPTLTTDERNACNRLGKSILAFMDGLSTYMINLAIAKQNERVKDMIAAMNAAASET